MTNDINLLSKKNRYSTQAQKAIKILKRIAIGLLCIDFLLVIILFIVRNDGLLATVLDEQKTVDNSLTSLQVKTVKILLLDERIQEIQTILHTRPAYDTLVSYIRSQLPGSVSMQTFTVDVKGSDITLGSSSLVDMGTLIDALSANVGPKKLFKQLTIEGLVEDRSGKYTLSLHAVI